MELNQELGLEWYDFGARNYDASLGRWMNLDPLAEQYANVTPYAFVANMPTIAVDPDGKRIVIVGNEDYRERILGALAMMYATKEGKKLVEQMVNSEDDVIIGNFRDGKGAVMKKNAYLGTSKNKKTGKTRSWVNINLNDNSNYSDGTPRTLEGSVSHELGHVSDRMEGKLDGTLVTTKDAARQGSATRLDEVNNVHRANKVRAGLGQELRKDYLNVRVMGMQRSNSVINFDDPNGFSTNAYELVPKPKNMFFDYSKISRATTSDYVKGVLYILSKHTKTKNNVQQFVKARIKLKQKTDAATILKK